MGFFWQITFNLKLRLTNTFYLVILSFTIIREGKTIFPYKQGQMRKAMLCYHHRSPAFFACTSCTHAPKGQRSGCIAALLCCCFQHFGERINFCKCLWEDLTLQYMISWQLHSNWQLLIGEVKVGAWVAYYNYQIPIAFLLFYSTDGHRYRTLSYSVLQQYVFVHKGFFSLLSYL